ncbi:uncharacterized protein DNG_01596 [Cephalotrichum gorgonifer]|uniref:Uncharacterized protein n=1 Tax=Cephalotrichum gorgonifer TaxID=2041049 RepID=A0AAE8MR81_9PEZI|nr:uncharacterized protein DNG_01596 [Cephalotrichum gorgonifer]
MRDGSGTDPVAHGHLSSIILIPTNQSLSGKWGEHHG